MRVSTFSGILAVLLLFSGCNQRENTPSTPASNRPASSSGDRPGVDVHTPNVDVRSDKEGTSVKAPGAEVHVEKK